MDELLVFRAMHKTTKENREGDSPSHIDHAKLPYFNQYGDLVIPFGSDPKYHYWNGGQSIKDTLKMLGSTRDKSKYLN